jgi:Uma2 family endonuclease
MALAARHPHDLTAEQYFALADELPPTAQLIEGEVVVVDTPAWRHQHAVGELYVRLRAWIAEAPGRGTCGIPLDVRVDDRNVYAPDVWWRAAGHELLPDEVRQMQHPDLAVEVLSPSTRTYDLGIKRRRYAENGLPELWIVDPKAATALVLRRSAPGAPAFDVEIDLGADGRLCSPQLPGFGVRVGDLLP